MSGEPDNQHIFSPFFLTEHPKTPQIGEQIRQQISPERDNCFSAEAELLSVEFCLGPKDER